MADLKRNFKYISLIILTILNILAWSYIIEIDRADFLEINFFDIGQGDAIFIKAPKNYQILIDGGPTTLILEKLQKEMPPYDKTLDLIILTHPDKDHLFGLNEVLKTYKVENIFWTGVDSEIEGFKEWKELLKNEINEGAKVFIADAPQKIIISDLIFYVLYPTDNLAGRKIENLNDTSIVSKLVFGENSIFFTGDISNSIEEKIIQECSLSSSLEQENLDSDILKVSHHGSKYATSNDFLENVSPEIAIISVGKNSFGHPSEETLKRLENFNIRVLRTDQLGDIKIILNKNNYITKF